MARAETAEITEEAGRGRTGTDRDAGSPQKDERGARVFGRPGVWAAGWLAGAARATTRLARRGY